MKVLISTLPFTGSINLFQAFATKLVTRDHQVLWLTGENHKAAVEATGATFIPLSPDCLGVLSDPTPDSGTSGMAAGLSLMRKMFIDPIPCLVKQYGEILNKHGFDAEKDVLVVDLVNLPALCLRDLGGPIYTSVGVVPLHTMVPEL